MSTSRSVDSLDDANKTLLQAEKDKREAISGDMTAEDGFVFIPEGEFMMGSAEDDPDAYEDEKPQHKVKVKEFLMKRTLVTQGEWAAVMGNNPSFFKKGDNYPVEMVSWFDAIKYCNRLSEIHGFTPVYILEGETGTPGTSGYRFSHIDVVDDADGYRLPTEEEWEYACRAGSTAAREENLDEVAWYYKNSGGETHPVGEKKPNLWGLYDMLGNVWEWCFSEYRSYPKKQ